MNETLTPSPTQPLAAKAALSVAEISQRAQAWRLVDADEAELQRVQHSLLTAQAASEEALRQSNDRLAAAITAGDLLLIEQTQGVIRAHHQEWQRLQRRLQTVADLQQEQKLFQRIAHRLGSATRARWFERTISLVVLLAVGLALITLTVTLSPALRWWISTVDLFLAIILIAEFFFRYSQAADERWFWRRYWLDLLASVPLQPILRLGRLWRLGRFARVWPLPWLGLTPPSLFFDGGVPALRTSGSPVQPLRPDLALVKPPPTLIAADAPPAATTMPQPRQQAALVAETVKLVDALQRLANQRSFAAIAATVTETILNDLDGVQAAVYWLVPRTQQLRQLQQMGAGQPFPTQLMVNEGPIGALVAQVLAKTAPASGELKPALAPGVVAGETVMVYPLVAGNQVMGALVLVAPADLARYYEYAHTPMILAHCTALALYAAEK